MSCGARTSGGDGAHLCAACSATIPLIGRDQCPRCGDALGPYAEGRRACPSCRDRAGLMFRGAVAAFRYEGVAREIVHRFKYGADLRAASWMGREMAAKLRQTGWFERIDAIVPVPLHWTRRLTRRFNQSELLAAAISRETGKPVLTRALRRTRKTLSQAALAVPQRAVNVKEAFRARRVKLVRGKTLLLADDVMTTCATAAECSRALLKAGARRVYVAVFAR